MGLHLFGCGLDAFFLFMYCMILVCLSFVVNDFYLDDNLNFTSLLYYKLLCAI